MITARLLWGALLVAAPDRLLPLVTGNPATPTQRAVLRMLGTRHLLQGLAAGIRPTPAVYRCGNAADMLHIATCVGAAMRWPQWRRLALVDGAVEIGLATCAGRQARTVFGTGRGRPRRR